MAGPVSNNRRTQAQIGKSVNIERSNINSPRPARDGPSTSTATQNKNILIQNYIKKRNVSNNESVKNLNESINLLSNILNLKNIEISSKNELEKYIKTTFSINNLRYKRLILQYILSIKDIIENKKINLISKVLFLLNYINISDLKNYNKQLQYVKKTKKNLLKFTSQFILKRIKKSSIKRPMIQNILTTQINNEPKYSNIKNANLNEIYEDTIRQNYHNIGRVLNINIKADEFYLLMAKDMIHDMKRIYVDKFHLLFSDIINNILKIKFNNDENEKLKKKLEKYTSKEQKTNLRYYSPDRILEPEILNELLKELENKVNQGKGFKKKVGDISTRLTDGVSKNLVAYKFKGSRRKYYKKFDILINSNSQFKNITRFIHGLYRRNEKSPVVTQLLTVSQLFNKGLGFVYHPQKKFYNFLRKDNIIGKDHGMNEKGINVRINLINNNNNCIGNFKISQEYDINNKKFYMLIDDNRINVTTASKSKNGSRQALGKFMGDFNMILKVIQENKQSNVSVVAFGTADKHAASIFIKLSKIVGIEPRLFFVKQPSHRANLAMVSYPMLYIIGMNDIISERVTKTKKNRDSFKRQRVKSTQHYKNATLPPNAANYTFVSNSNNSNNNSNNKSNNKSNNTTNNDNFMLYLQNVISKPKKTKTKSPKSQNTNPRKQFVRTPIKDPHKGIKNELARRHGRSPKK